MSSRTSASSPTGSVAAALLAAGVGACFIGLIVILAEASTAVSSRRSFYAPTGSLSGKAILTVLVWLLTWAVLHRRWAKRDVDIVKAMRLATFLVALGLLGTFPPFFYLFD
jgi:hypothetical protein